MATTAMPPAVRWAKQPFHFNSAARLLCIGQEQATTLGELLEALRSCPGGSIFQHTFQTLQEHHFIREGFSNDFAHWTFAACNEVGLAERLAAVDVREYTSVADLRRELVRIVEGYLQRNARARDRAAFEPFYFCTAETVVIPTPYVARSLGEFRAALERVSIHCIHYHFIDARLRLKLTSNDFSLWLKEELDLGAAAERIDRIDIYTSTLNDVREQMLRILEGTKGANARRGGR